jgi:nucleoside-diphosphate-sugar epimerase
MKILITGGNGFLGSNLSKYLLNYGHDICVTSRNSFNLIDILDKINFYQTSNICSSHKQELFDFSPDIIIDCAWDGGSSYYQANSLDQFRSNMPRCLDLLETFKNFKNKPMFFGFGSFAEYGIINKRAQETQTEFPVSYYGLSKLVIKEISKMFCEQNNFNWTWIRPCYIYGPNDVSTRLIPRLIKHSIQNEPLKLDSCQINIDYLHVDDFCAGVYSLITTKKTGVFNICSGNEYSLTNIINFIQNKIGTNIVTYDASLDRHYSSKYICGSNEKLKKETNWNPNVCFEDSIIDLINLENKKINTII